MINAYLLSIWLIVTPIVNSNLYNSDVIYITESEGLVGDFDSTSSSSFTISSGTTLTITPLPSIDTILSQEIIPIMEESK